MDLTAEQIKLVNIIESYFSKDITNEKPLILQVTNDLFNKLQTLYPSDQYEAADVFTAMEYLKFDSLMSSEGSIKWLYTELK
jgi:ABC-type microcin C transport system permease subunit YejE